MKIPAIALSLVGIFTILSSAFAGEIMIHDGPIVSVPAAELMGPNRPPDYKPPEIRFTKQFFVDEKDLAKISGKKSATEAKAIALTSVFPGDGSDGAKVTKLELLESIAIPDRTLQYFLITFSVNGSEEHRIVLHDGRVIEPRLKRIED